MEAFTGKSQFPSTFGWQSTNPSIGFLPAPGPNQSVAGNSPSSNVTAGVFSGNQTIYTNILGLQQIDSHGLEITITGTPTGTFTVMCSNSGINFYALTFNPAIIQPSGSPEGFLIALQQVPFRYIYLQYANTSGSGTISAYAQSKSIGS